MTSTCIFILFTFTFSHLADAFIQSDLQMEQSNQQKSNDMQMP